MTSNSPHAVGKAGYLGLFLTTLSALMYEILLTRIFSVTMWYHFAFMVISVAMFGMTVGAVLVYLYPAFFSQERAKHRMALAALLFALAICFSFLTHLCMPYVGDRYRTGTILAIHSTALIYTVAAVPFVFSGICVCLALTRFPRQVSRLYAADLAGAALGCILLVKTLTLTDGPTAVFVTASLAAAGAACFATAAGSRRLTGAAAVVCGLLVAFSAENTRAIRHQRTHLPLVWVKGLPEPTPQYEKWNSFSRVVVTGDGSEPRKPTGWGLSDRMPATLTARELTLLIDSFAATVMTHFDGDLAGLEHLKYDVTNLAHYMRTNATVLIIGSGAGRDVLSALAFEQKAILAIEMNKDIIDTVNRVYGDFTGHLDQYPNVRFVHDEARSYIARLDEDFDMLQISLIDTFAATAAGAFVLAENSLYTVDAWTSFLEHLSPRGVLTVSHWYLRDGPAAMYRMVAMANTALRRLGLSNPREHILVARVMGRRPDGQPGNVGVGNLIVSIAPLSEAELRAVRAAAEERGFDIVLSPDQAEDELFARLATEKDLRALTASYPVNIAPPTDNSPFFFNMLRLRDAFSPHKQEMSVLQFNMKAVTTLAALLLVVLVLTALCILLPIALTADRQSVSRGMSHLVFFACIGLAFMFVEIAMMQRLIVFLGHPTYGLTVMLFTILLASGLGSFTTRRIDPAKLGASASWRLTALLLVVGLIGLATPSVIRLLRPQPTPFRIAASVGLLFPLGLMMGMPFPLGMRLASARFANLTPWLWAINGAMSVSASVLAVVIALGSTIGTTFWTGFACYAVATTVMLRMTREPPKDA